MREETRGASVVAKTSITKSSEAAKRPDTSTTLHKRRVQVLKQNRNRKTTVAEFEAVRRDAQKKGLDRLTLRDINRLIKQARQERRKKLAKI
jgi:hypothetical protein